MRKWLTLTGVVFGILLMSVFSVLLGYVCYSFLYGPIPEADLKKIKSTNQPFKDKKGYDFKHKVNLQGVYDLDNRKSKNKKALKQANIELNKASGKIYNFLYEEFSGLDKTSSEEIKQKGVVGSFSVHIRTFYNEQEAKRFVNFLKQKQYGAFIISEQKFYDKQKTYKVCIGSYINFLDAMRDLSQYKNFISRQAKVIRIKK